MSGSTRLVWVNESTVFGTIKKDTEKSRRGSPRRASLLPARTAASSYGPASTSIQSTFCRCVLVVSCGGGRSSPRFEDERRMIVVSLFALCMSGQAATGQHDGSALLQPDFAHCAQSPEHHHRPASCHGELLLRPLARLSEYPLLPEGRILALYWVHRGVVGSHHVPSNFPPQSSGARSTRAPGTRFRSQTVVARRRPSEVRRHSCSTLLDTLPPS